MGQCFLYGNGSAGTGLTIVSGLTEPVKPKENMIWVKSDKAGKKYVFAEAAPEAPFEGLIWFTATYSGIITKANVYTSGSWVAADAYMYLSGAWMAISTAVTYLFASGLGSRYNITKYIDSRASIDVNADKIAINSTSSAGAGYIGGVLNIGPFDASKFKTICVDMEYLRAETGFPAWQASFGVVASEWTDYDKHLVDNCVKFAANVFPRKIVTLDIQAFAGNLYFVWNGAGVANIFNIWVE